MIFYNRLKETNDIIQMITKDNGRNKIIILYGTTGVGKSGLVRKLLGEDLNEISSVRVRVSKSSIDTIENLYYLNAMYKAIYELSKKKSFDKIPSPAKQGVLNWKRIIQFLWELAKSKVGIEENNRLFEPVNHIEIIRKKDYIIEVLKKKQFIINIENVQNIDTQSLEIINEILSKVSHTTFVFEYTLGQDSSENLMNFINELSTDETRVFHYEINKLDFEEAKQLAPGYNSQTYDENILKSIYVNGNGNLMRIIMANPNMASEENPIKYSLEMLGKDEKFIINLIYLNDGIINVVQLSQIIMHGSKLGSIDLEHSHFLFLLNNLDENKIINITENTIIMAHDSIITELENQKVNPILYSAYSLIIEYYCMQKEQFPQDETNIEKLFSLYLKFSDESILYILDDLKKMIIKCKYPQNILAKLSHLKEKLLQKQNPNPKSVYEITLMMLGVSYDMELMEMAEENLNLIFDPRNSLHLAYRTGILAMNSSNLQNHKLIKELIQQTKKGSRLRLVMELNLLSAMMQVCPLLESKKFAEKMLYEIGYQQFIEYGFLLRNYAELVETSKSIEIYHKCISFFENFTRKDLQSQIYISMAMCYAYKGELEIASSYLTKSINISNQLLKENFILNNFAVIEMLSGNFSEQVVKNLNDALLITSNDYELIIIRCNLLIYYVNTRQHLLAKQMCNTIEQSGFERFQYEEFLHIVYLNLSFFYDCYEDFNKKNIYKNKMEELLSRNTIDPEISNYIKLTLENKQSEEFFYTKFPFRADFLGYWGFEISRELEHSELAF